MSDESGRNAEDPSGLLRSASAREPGERGRQHEAARSRPGLQSNRSRMHAQKIFAPSPVPRAVREMTAASPDEGDPLADAELVPSLARAPDQIARRQTA